MVNEFGSVSWENRNKDVILGLATAYFALDEEMDEKKERRVWVHDILKRRPFLSKKCQHKYFPGLCHV